MSGCQVGLPTQPTPTAALSQSLSSCLLCMTRSLSFLSFLKLSVPVFPPSPAFSLLLQPFLSLSPFLFSSFLLFLSLLGSPWPCVLFQRELPLWTVKDPGFGV